MREDSDRQKEREKRGLRSPRRLGRPFMSSRGRNPYSAGNREEDEMLNEWRDRSATGNEREELFDVNGARGIARACTNV